MPSTHITSSAPELTGGFFSFRERKEIVILLAQGIALAYLTDRQGPFPELSPAYPVIWSSIYKPSNYPFCDIVDVPLQAN